MLSAFSQALLEIDAKTFAMIILENQYLIADLTALAPIWFILITDKFLINEVGKIFKYSNRVTPLTQHIHGIPK
uniref:Uncharacterized protein n=1 Tax=Panagrolaimus sp. PS1159 TaxID=55785 RepID=A0AC35G9F7_9BILA